MSEYEIEKDVPLPPMRRVVYFPFDKMEVGDSFVVAFSKHPTAFVMAHATSAQPRLDMRFEVRVTDEGTRVWRIG